jgi:flagellar hook-length control protein FliK
MQLMNLLALAAPQANAAATAADAAVGTEGAFGEALQAALAAGGQLTEHMKSALNGTGAGTGETGEPRAGRLVGLLGRRGEQGAGSVKDALAGLEQMLERLTLGQAPVVQPTALTQAAAPTEDAEAATTDAKAAATTDTKTTAATTAEADPVADLLTKLQAAADAATEKAKAVLDNLPIATGAGGILEMRLNRMMARLDRLETRLTGVDPKAPPEGWTEPAAFAQARTALQNLINGASQAPTDGTTPDPVVTAAAAHAQIATARAAIQDAVASVRPKTTAATKFADARLTAGEGAARLRDRLSGQDSESVRHTGKITEIEAPKAEVGAVQADKPAVTTAASIQEAVQAAEEPAKAGAQAEVQAVTTTSTREAIQAADRTVADKAAAASATLHSTPETVAHLTAHISKRLSGQSTSFDLELHPADLGRVDVKINIDRDGRLAAQMAFDNPLAAADLRGRADELRRSLEQAGFQVADDALSFTERDSGGSDSFQQAAQQQTSDDGSRRQGRVRAFQDGERTALTADTTLRYERRAALGLDLRI